MNPHHTAQAGAEHTHSLHIHVHVSHLADALIQCDTYIFILLIQANTQANTHTSVDTYKHTHIKHTYKHTHADTQTHLLTNQGNQGWKKLGSLLF